MCTAILLDSTLIREDDFRSIDLLIDSAALHSIHDYVATSPDKSEYNPYEASNEAAYFKARSAADSIAEFALGVDNSLLGYRYALKEAYTNLYGKVGTLEREKLLLSGLSAMLYVARDLEDRIDGYEGMAGYFEAHPTEMPSEDLELEMLSMVMLSGLLIDISTYLSGVLRSNYNQKISTLLQLNKKRLEQLPLTTDIGSFDELDETEERVIIN